MPEVSTLWWKLAMLVLLTGACLAPSSAAAQADPAGLDGYAAAAAPAHRIMYLGVFHFAYPDLDVHKPTHRVDVLSSRRQREIEEVLERIALYQPTRIAVEVGPQLQPRLDSLYAAFRAGRWEPGRNEVYQLGFRLAARLGHDRVYAVDAERHDFFVDLARAELEPRARELFDTDREWRERLTRVREREDSLAAARDESLREILLRGNSPERLRRDHMSYSVGFFKFDGEEGGFLGTDFVSGWYNRNLRIFRNLQRITESPAERILLIVGSGHLPILRFVTQHSPEYELVEAGEYLAR